jgi:CMP-N,N'-diacetyllegionaminic acid synthase
MNDFTITALLTGRGNNTLADKNVLHVLGRPILQYPALAARNSNMINRFWVSSDCDKILNAAQEVGYERIKRPEEYARPDAQHIDVIDHALGYMKEHGDEPDLLLVLLANTVTVKPEWIRDCISKIIHDPTITACVPVHKEMDHHPYRAKKIDTNGYLEPFFDFAGKKVSTNRQDLEPSFFLCHNFWVLNLKIIDRSKGQPPWVFMGDKIAPYEVDEAFDVHNTDDLIRSEKWLKNNQVQ